MSKIVQGLGFDIDFEDFMVGRRDSKSMWQSRSSGPMYVLFDPSKT